MAKPPAPPILTPPIIQPVDSSSFSERSTATMLPCNACGSPRQPGSRFCTACGVPFETPQDAPVPIRRPPLPRDADRSSRASRKNSDRTLAPTGPALAPTQTNEAKRGIGSSFHCENCGADVDVPPGGSSLRCPFCDSTYVVELPKEQRRTQPPEFVIGFAITREKALELFFQWLGKNNWFRPGDLVRKAATDKQQGIYLPFWHFSMIANSQWSAQIGEYWYRTETYTVRTSDGKTVTRTRQVRETEWWPLSGEYRKYYSGYMVSASKGLPQAEAVAIQPYQLSQMMRYRPHYVAGWLVEEYSIAKDQAVEVAKSEFMRREQQSIAAFLPGDTHSGLNVSTSLEVGGTDLVLLPVHVLSYRYRDRVYRFLVNGQTGKIYGEKPWSGMRITIAIIGASLLLLILIAIVILITHPRIGN